MTDPERLGRAIEWINNNVDNFSNKKAIFSGGDVENLKHCSELVLVLTLFVSLNFRREWALDILAHLWKRVFQGGNLFRDILTVRPDMLTVLSTYANFHECGFSHSGVDAMARKFAALEWISVLPMPAWRNIDILNSLDRLGIAAFPPTARERCWISKAPPINIINVDFAYAITHEIFYLTDFGRLNHRLTHGDLSFLGVALPVWRRHYKSENDLDLLAEFSLCELYTTNLLDSESLSHCSLLQREDGSFPGPDRVKNGVAPQGDGLDAFRCDYHTTLVICALLATNEIKKLG